MGLCKYSEINLSNKNTRKFSVFEDLFFTKKRIRILNHIFPDYSFNRWLSFDEDQNNKYPIIHFICPQVENYGPVSAEKHRKSLERGSSIATANFSDFFR